MMTRKPGNNGYILVVDDDAGQRSLLSTFLTREGFDILQAATGKEALDILDSRNIRMMITDVRMPGISGIELMQESRKRRNTLPVLLVTAYPDVRDAVDSVKDGAVNYLQKPIDLDELRKSIDASISSVKPRRISEKAEFQLPDDVIAESSAMKELFREALLVARSESRVLITGESGAGKEVVADFIHRNSPRSGADFVKINCAAIPEDLLESELFGHEKGAFTGAVNRRIGRFEEANRGTILLDEIAEMSAPLQAKLLRITQNGVFYRVGSSRPIQTDVRIVAATNRNLDKEVENGNFREDLFYRLNVFEIYAPALRERPEDIIPIAEHFASIFHVDKLRFSENVAEMFRAYDWPGNVRELRNAIERASLLCRGDVILPEHLPPRLKKAASGISSDTSRKGSTMEDVEREAILKTLRECNYNRSLTARKLGISRRALLYKIKRYKKQGYATEGQTL